ncbi:exostosin family protein [Leptolyngbya sp. Heron Island J]|uniref:exostosin domain-containing protein n=1 Tax=Leptolyngbya sp. Heron Island J TaxID=1385935 RepID=UPI0003B9AB92|nr:exostosin family protein [Leptolyngbya sp. Heron Island J]ESA36804.1 exostosin family protein [Leptolyngbya sp. Heron Island J]
MKLKIFSSREYLPEGVDPSSILYPLWSDLHSELIYQWASPYIKYVQDRANLFELTSLADADVAILPFDWRSIRGDSWRGTTDQAGMTLALEFADLVQKAGKPLVVFFGSECSDEALPIDNALIFRQSVYRSDAKFAKTPIFPFFCEDFVAKYLDNQVPIRKKSQKPTVGFRGFARPPSLDRHIKTFYYHSHNLLKHSKLGTSPYKGEVLRTKALSILQNSDLVNDNIEVFERAVFFEATDPTDKMKARMDYVDNLVNSDYVFCCRGSGNYSNRFYEVLSCGRIPIFLDTDCKLPLEEFINWKDYCIWVDEKDMPNIAEIVANFHGKLSDTEFEDLQHECRNLWLNYLSPEGYYSKFAQIVEKSILVAA